MALAERNLQLQSQCNLLHHISLHYVKPNEPYEDLYQWLQHGSIWQNKVWVRTHEQKESSYWNSWKDMAPFNLGGSQRKDYKMPWNMVKLKQPISPRNIHFCKLDGISTNSTKGVNDSPLSASSCMSRGNAFRSDRIPSFFIHFNSLVKPWKQRISLFPILGNATIYSNRRRTFISVIQVPLLN